MEDPIDGGDAVRTAVRELHEELGVGPERVHIVGRLPELKQNLNRFVIAPVVGVLDPGTRFLVDGGEIAGVFSVPLASIVSSGAIYEDAEAGAARGRAMYAFDHDGRHIWGFTGRVLKAFADAWAAPESPLRAAVRALIPSSED